MKVVVGIVALLLVGLSLLADYKWKQWMARRKAADTQQDRSRNN